MSLENMNDHQLQLHLFKEEAAARMIAFREHRTAPSLSADQASWSLNW